MAQAKRRRKRKIFSPVYLTLVLIVLYLPILMVVIYSFNSGRTIGSWQGFTTNWYSRLFSNALMADALKNSLVLAVVSSLLAGGIGTLGAIGLARSHLKLGGAVETIATLPMMIPELVLGMAYLSVFTAVGFKLGMGALVLTHTTFCIPYVFINVKSRLIGMDPSLSEAARDLGASPARVLKDITLPLVFPAVLSGMMLSAAMSLDDVVISFFVTSADHPAAQGLHRPAFRRHAGDQRALHPDARRDLYLCGRYSIDNGQKQRKTPISIKRIPRLR